MIAMNVILLMALAFNGLLSGMTLDQSVKQLPARHRIGVSAYSAYSRASDLGNGIAFYAVFGLAAPASAVAFAIAAYRTVGTNHPLFIPALLAALFSASQLIFTAGAAPTNFSQRRYDLADEAALTAVFDRFERFQTWRSVSVTLGFACLLWAAGVLLASLS